MIEADLAGNVTLRDAYARRIEAIEKGVATGTVVDAGHRAGKKAT
jgi:hypothetical protein